MPKTSEVSYYASRKGYYAWIAGKQTRLAKGPKDEPHGPTYRKALKAFTEAMELAAVGQADAPLTVKAVLEVYLREHVASLAPNTVEIRTVTARQFIGRFPGLLTSELAGQHLQTFIRDGRVRGAGTPGSKPWNDTTCRMRLHQLGIMLRWGMDEGYITGNPLPRKSQQAFKSRARDRIVTPDEHARVLAFLNQRTHHRFTAVVIALENTGARLSEIISARVQDWHDDMGALLYYSDKVRREGEFRHKSAAKKDRMIFFTGEACEMMRYLVKDKSPDDWIFKGRTGNPYTTKGAAHNFIRIGQETGLRHVTAHAYRHTFATRWLQRDGNIDALAECLGNTPETIRRTYSHLLKDPVGLRAKLESVMLRGTEIRP